MIDEFGLPGTKGVNGRFDGGDSAAILGTCLALGDQTFSPDLLNHFISPKGLPRRHPDITKWYGQDDRFSRDQLIPLICAGIRLGGHPAIDKLHLAHAKRDFRTAWNVRGNGSMDAKLKEPDMCGPEIWALWLRYTRAKNIRIHLWDSETLASAVQWRLGRKDRVTRNHMLVSIIAKEFRPTPTSRLAYWTNDWDDLINRWDQHCKAVGEYQTADLFKAVIK